MNLLWAHIRSQSATIAVVAALCLAPITAHATNPWNPYPSAQPSPSPMPAPTPVPKSKYYEEPTPLAPAQAAPGDGPSRFAPPDLDRQLSVPPQQQQNTYATPYGYQGAPLTPYATPPAYNGPPPAGFPQGNPMGAPPPYMGGYGPPPGNNSWGGSPGNNFSPFGFW